MWSSLRKHKTQRAEASRPRGAAAPFCTGHQGHSNIQAKPACTPLRAAVSVAKLFYWSRKSIRASLASRLPVVTRGCRAHGAHRCPALRLPPPGAAFQMAKRAMTDVNPHAVKGRGGGTCGCRNWLVQGVGGWAAGHAGHAAGHAPFRACAGLGMQHDMQPVPRSPLHHAAMMATEAVAAPAPAAACGMQRAPRAFQQPSHAPSITLTNNLCWPGSATSSASIAAVPHAPPPTPARSAGAQLPPQCFCVCLTQGLL